MAEKILTIKGGASPYDDGSGYRVDFKIEQEGPDTEPTISIEGVYALPASEWPQVARTIEHLISATRWQR